MRLQSLVSLVIVGVAGPTAYADSTPRRLFVPVLSDAPDAKVDRVLRAFELTAGEGAIRNAPAAQQFERMRSREPADSSTEEIARDEAAAEAAVKQLGSGRLREGRSTLERVERRLEGDRGDAYRRSGERVQVLFDACSLAAMLLARAKRRDDAASQMAHCVRTYPGSEPEGEPEIQPLFDAATARIPHGMLHVEGEDGCGVRANGIELGQVPLKMALPVGDYRLQLECTDAPGRVHSVPVREGENRFTADPLDASVHTRRGLWLRRGESTDSDGQELGRLLSAQVVLLIGEGERVRVRTAGRDIAVLGPGDDVRPIVPLLEAPEDDVSAAPANVPAPAAALVLDVPAEAPADAPGRSTMEYVAGISLVVVGIGSLTAGWVLYAERYSMRSAIYGADVPYDIRDRFESLGSAAIGVSAFGAALLVVAEPLLVSDGGAPGAAWVLAGGGLVLAAVGIAFGFADHCQPQVASQNASGSACGFVDDAIFGPLLALHGLPLLTLPASYGLRELIGGESTVVLGFDGAAGHVGVRGTF